MNEEKRKKHSFLAKGMILGTAIGVVCGITILDNVGMGICIGILTGTLIGCIADIVRNNKKKKVEN